MATVDCKMAAIILDRALVDACQLSDSKAQQIDFILTGKLITYKYMMVTALLAKATNAKINILSLQADDGKKGKYDARSLCHHVIVPFEKMHLPGCLGNSNEPFLNNPARLPFIDKATPVRGEEGKKTLVALYDSLHDISDSETAYKYLRHALFRMKENSEAYVAKFSVGDLVIDISEFSQLVLDYIYAITDRPMDGEICPLIVSELEKMYLGNGYKVVPHKVNQSGASPKEIGDIDVFDNQDNIIYSIEVKDKDFNENDVLHAIQKFRAAHLASSLFIYGKNVSFDEDKVCAELKRIGREGHYCCLISILNYAKLRIADLKTLTVRDFVDGLLKFAKVINAKDDTINEIKYIAQHIFSC